MTQHATSPDSYGSLQDLVLAACPSACSPLSGLPAPEAALPVPAGVSGPVKLYGGGVSVFWQLSGDDGVTFTVRAAERAQWAALAFGQGMIGAHAYVAWQDAAGRLRVDAYAMSSLAASGVTRATGEPVNVTAVSRVAGVLSFTFYRPFAGAAAGVAPAIDPGNVGLLWALGDGWGDPLADAAQHFSRSALPTILDLRTGQARSGAPPPPSAALVAHGALMFVAFAVLLPAAAAAARYLRAGAVLSGPGAWMRAHTALAAAALAAAAGGTAAALALELRERGSAALRSPHAQVGVAALVLLAAQPLLALRRPLPAARGAAGWTRRRIWTLAHRGGAAAAAAAGLGALFTGIDAACGRGVANCAALRAALAAWVAVLAAYAAAREAAAACRPRPAGPAPLAALAKAAAAGGPEAPPAAGPPADDGAGPPAGLGGETAGGPDGAAADAAWELRWAWAAAGWVAAAGLIAAVIAAGFAGGGAGAGGLPECGGGAAAAAAADAGAGASAGAGGGVGAGAGAGVAGCVLTEGFELARLGDGWCDAGAPYNTAGCRYDGGDCCPRANGTARAPLFDCADPASPHRGAASPRGPVWPAPRNPRYADGGPGRPESAAGLVAGYNNFYEFTTGKAVAPLVTAAARDALALGAEWRVRVDGAVAAPLDLDLRDLLAMFQVTALHDLPGRA